MKTGNNVDKVRALMAAESWRAAVLLVASFPRIPEKIRDRVLSAREAYLRPEFQRQIKRDPDVLIADGKKALLDEFGQ